MGETERGEKKLEAEGLLRVTRFGSIELGTLMNMPNRQDARDVINEKFLANIVASVVSQ